MQLYKWFLTVWSLFKYAANQQALSRESLHIFCGLYIYKYNEGKHRYWLDTQAGQVLKGAALVVDNQLGRELVNKNLKWP